ncbi:hypothetical protein NECAME_09035 [Necator americanus]|uniref:Uncharacterized protein n=1 Tax=Necator americanus TaxID=51031 RepID=W2TF43_NECAM|nr:hypothetical protein NECAME_09035 [Necator americanus]ETN80675.1 hypothetical protein NECAME_09035 [Necator americanus]
MGPCMSPPCRPILICLHDEFNACEAMVCPPSQRCVADPAPKCVKYIPTVSSVIGRGQLATNH